MPRWETALLPWDLLCSPGRIAWEGDTQTDIATTRPKRPKGRFGEDYSGANQSVWNPLGKQIWNPCGSSLAVLLFQSTGQDLLVFLAQEVWVDVGELEGGEDCRVRD